MCTQTGNGRTRRVRILALMVIVLAATAGAPVAAAHDAHVQIVAVKCEVREGEDLTDEWVRLSNLGDHDVSLRGWVLESEEQARSFVLRGFQFPPGITLAPGDALTVHTGVGDDDTEGSAKHVYWDRSEEVWKDDGDTATVRNLDGDVVDEEGCLDGLGENTPVSSCIAPGTAEALADGDIRLSWTTAGEVDTVDFTILRATGGAELEPVAVLPEDADGFVDETTKPGVTYRYSIAVSSIAAGPWDPDCEAPDVVEVTAIPFFPGAAWVALGVAGAVCALVIARRL